MIIEYDPTTLAPLGMVVSKDELLVGDDDDVRKEFDTTRKRIATMTTMIPSAGHTP